MKTNTHTQYNSDIEALINDLYQPNYITNAFSNIGIKKLTILSQVFKVDKSYLGNYFAQILYKNNNLYENKNILDIGCGCGILGLICSKMGAKHVCFSDINPLAIKNSKINSILLKLKNTSFICSDLFKNIPSKKKFDVILFNPPNIKGPPTDTTKAALIREDRLILDFFKNYPKYLSKKGIVIMPGSSRFDGKLSPPKMAKKYGLEFIFLDKEIETINNYKYIVLIKNN
jgi:methylase of polypeptide subunit release factors